jgi:diketogulonate reductase-like aldo/keto reductase
MIPSLSLPDGTKVPALGQGTWHMGERASDARREADALRLGIDLGMTLIDTAEMYAEGKSEEVVAQAIAGQRDRVFLVSKVYPHNASRAGVQAACARSLRRLGTDRIDLYLLHWPGSHPIAETIAGFQALLQAGHIRHWGVSNFDAAGMHAVHDAPGGAGCATDQVLYHPDSRGIEFDLLPWCARHRMPVMAYSPVGQAGRLLRSRALNEVAKRHDATAAQIPKAADPEHVRQNAAAAALKLTAEDLATIDAAHRPPNRREPLGML